MTKTKISVKFSPANKKTGGLSFSSQKTDASHHVKDPDLPVETPNEPAPPVEASGEECPVMAFRINNYWFALKQHPVHQVASFAAPRALPWKTNEVFRGLVYAAGANYLCFSFHGLLGMTIPEEPSLRKNGRPRLIVIGMGEERWAFMVEEMIITAILLPQEQGEKMAITTVWGDITVVQSVDLQGKKVELLDEETLFKVLNRSLIV